MKYFSVVLLSFIGFSTYAAGQCFDPRTAFIRCQAGTEFAGWDKGDCPGILVKGAICSPVVNSSVCFDPRAALVQCKAGTEFKGWDKGNCTGILVKGAICE